MHTAFIDTAVVTAIQDDYRSRARRRADTGSTATTSRFARLHWIRRTGDRDALVATARTAVGRVPRVSHGANPS